jgi:hypothetical protein
MSENCDGELLIYITLKSITEIDSGGIYWLKPFDKIPKLL